MEEECKHDVDTGSASIAECNGNDTVIVDVWCKRCGKSGSTIVSASYFEFDEPCEVKDGM